MPKGTDDHVGFFPPQSKQILVRQRGSNGVRRTHLVGRLGLELLKDFERLGFRRQRHGRGSGWADWWAGDLAGGSATCGWNGSLPVLVLAEAALNRGKLNEADVVVVDGTGQWERRAANAGIRPNLFRSAD